MSVPKSYMEYLPYASLKQKDYIYAIEDCGAQSKAAKKLGIGERTLSRGLDRLRKSAAKRGYSPEHGMTRTVPEPFLVRGVSTYYNAKGELAGQWVKSAIDGEKLQLMMDEALCAFGEALPRAKAVGEPIKKLPNELVNLYVLTDYHVGMKSWGEETGDDWDTDIAERLLVAWFEQAIRLSPDSEVGIFCQLGDFLHWDGMDAVTPASRHLLDADTRFQKLIRVTIKVIRRITAMLLAKHKYVHLIMAEGNHDTASSAWLREVFYAFFDNEPRITVDISPDPYYCYEHGKTALFFHHGHKRKPAGIDTVLVAKYREVFGRTKFAYAHMGHLHHIDQKETNLMVVKQHRTLAAKDAYASRGGWMSGREAEVITYHKDYGQVSSLTINPDMVRDANTVRDAKT